MTITSDGSDFGGFTSVATNLQAFTMTGPQALATGIWPSWWLGSATTGGGVGTAGPQTGGRGDIAGISTRPIPVSWGSRRVEGAVVVDKIVKPIGPDGYGAEILCLSAGAPLLRDRANNLGKIIANSTEIWNDVVGVAHPAVASVVWYDGTSDSQIQDPTFVAEYGADLVPGYVGQMIAVIDYNTYEPWNGARPSHTIYVSDEGGGSLFIAWGGTLDPDAMDPDIELTDGDLTALNHGSGFGPQGTVLGTIGRSTGLRCFEFEQVTAGARVGLAKSDANLGFFLGSQDDKSLALLPTGEGYIAGVYAGTIGPAFTIAQRLQILVNLTTRRMWSTVNGTAYIGQAGATFTAADVAAGTGGVDISHANLAGVLYPAIGLAGEDDSATAIFDEDAFVYAPPGEAGNTNWGEVFVALAALSNLNPDKINAETVTEESEGGIIYGGMSWSDSVLNSGRLANIDYVENFDEIDVIQTEIEDPEPVVDEIPSNHRYIIDENKGSTTAERGGQRRKPTVVELSYYDVSRQYQQSMVPARSEAHDSVTVERISTFWVMTASAAASRSAVALGKTEMEFQQFNHSLPPIVPYIQLRPIDIVEFDEEGIVVRTKAKSWNLDTDWGLSIEYQFLFRSANPEIPLTLESTETSLARYITTGGIDFSKRGNSGYVAGISGQ